MNLLNLFYSLKKNGIDDFQKKLCLKTVLNRMLNIYHIKKVISLLYSKEELILYNYFLYFEWKILRLRLTKQPELIANYSTTVHLHLVYVWLKLWPKQSARSQINILMYSIIRIPS